MMAAEGPLLAAVVARLALPTINLAAYGVAAAVAMLIESPVIGLLSAVITLANTRQSVEQLRRFMIRVNVAVSTVMVIACLPWVFEPLARMMLGLGHDVAWRVHGGLVCMIPWPAAIGVRRFYQGLLIRQGRTRSVAHGTVVRLTMMASTAFILSWFNLEGVLVGCIGLTVGVVCEAIAIWLIARRLPDPQSVIVQEDLTTKAIMQFYLPLALTSIVSFLAVPLLSVFISRLPAPIESLAVLPVVNALLFVFRSFGFSYQEVGIAFVGQDKNTYPVVRRVGLWITIGTTAAMLIVSFTPLLGWLYEHVFALKTSLVSMAILPTQLLIIIPMTAAMYSLQRAVMITSRRTIHVSISMIIEVGSMAMLMLLLISLQHVMHIDGMLAASIATATGMILSTAYAFVISRRERHSWTLST